MKIGLIAGVVLALVAIAVLGGALYVIDETQQVIITQFGRPIIDPDSPTKGAIVTPGIHLKMPFIQKANFFEKRFLEWNGDPNEVPTKDKRFIQVDTYARWRITDPLLFFQRLRDERGALTRLDDIIDGETRNALAGADVIEIIRSSNRDVEIDEDLAANEQVTSLENIRRGRLDIMADILTESQKRAADLGIEILDVRFKRINYNDDVQRSVYARMIAERKRIADRFRSEGLGASAEIRGDKERDLKRIESEAFRKSQEIIGAADAEASRIYAAAYGRDPEFYRFFKSMEAYRQTLDASTTFIQSTESDFFNYLRSKEGR